MTSIYQTYQSSSPRDHAFSNNRVTPPVAKPFARQASFYEAGKFEFMEKPTRPISDLQQTINAAASVVLALALPRGAFVFPYNEAQGRGYCDADGVHLILPLSKRGSAGKSLFIDIDLCGNTRCRPSLQPGELAAALLLAKREIHQVPLASRLRMIG